MQRTPAFALSALALTGALACGLAHAQASEPVIGLITKTETNPFFVKMKEGATAEAKRLGARLVSAAGKTDGDNAGQVTAMENLIAAGAKTILITPSDAKAIVPAIKKAQARGVIFVAGSAFFVSGDERRFIRLSFSSPTPERIREGVARLALAVTDAEAVAASTAPASR